MKRAVVFGDALVADVRRPRPSFARLLPPLLGWYGMVMGREGPGFVRLPTDPRRAYASRLEALLARDPDVVVVQVSGNDARADLDMVRQAAREFLTAVTAAVPVVYVLGPLVGPFQSDLVPLRDAVRAVAQDVGAHFIDGLGWLTPAVLTPNGEYPTLRGHLRLARRTARAVRALGT